jgi:uncharacterized membrane protein YkvA (DUF1232 family)
MGAVRRRARKMKRRMWAAYLCLRDPETPWVARAAIAVALAYALSPIDLIPDFIPLLGQLDDLILVPALLALALRLIPAQVAARHRREAWMLFRQGQKISLPGARYAAAGALALWLALLALALWLIFR